MKRVTKKDWLTFIVFLAFIVVAYALFQGSRGLKENTEGYSKEDVPLMELTYLGKSYEGERGSGCWPNKVLEGTVCWDTAFPDPKTKISVVRGDRVFIKVHSYKNAKSLSGSIFTLDQKYVKGLTFDQYRIFREVQVPIDLPLGEYVMTLGGSWGVGDVSYAFKISVTDSVIGSDRSVKLIGEVVEGQMFERDIGAGLIFRLVPGEHGWTIFIGDKNKPENNFSSVATPPYHGVNNIDIKGWHFRNSDNTGQNEPGAKNVNTPGDVRKFYFVLNNTEYQKASDALQKILYSYSYSIQEVEEAEHVHVLKGWGTLTVKDLKLNTLEADKQAGIDSMKFEVEFFFPPPGRLGIY